MTNSPTSGSTPLAESRLSLREIAAFLLLYRWVIGLSAIVGLGLATLLAYGLPYTYTAHALVFVERGKDPTLRTELTSLTVEVNEAIETEIQFMTSRTVAETVVEAMGLDQRPHKPSTLGNFIDHISETLENAGLVTPLPPREAAVRAFIKTLKCKQPPLTWTIGLHYSAQDPADAVQVLDRTLDAYLEHRRAVNRSDAAEFFRQRSTELETALVARRKSREQLTEPGALQQIDLEIRTLETAFTANRERLDRALAEAVADRSLYNVRIIDRPTLPARPDQQRLILVIAGLVAGVMCGLFTALLRAHFDQTVRVPADLQRCGLEVLGTLPQSRMLARKRP